ncbi:MAG: methylmalonyl Co-A mutase-associated GTPase MeaB [Deltaproteobacteria bacterium]|nr:methylmalonyl Co-A mutase-associated GTPase MeaB [Deltaproteobacteria bacterium]
MADIDKLIRETLKGDKLAVSRLISVVERGHAQTPYILEKIYPHSGNAYYIGVTGPPGSGKSTTVDRLVKMLCSNNYSVGVIAVDPCSPFSGGALLGDRIRMNKRKSEWDVFFRSMSAGKIMGGLARTTKESSRILDASGKQIIVIETVGVGQSELDIAQATDTVVVILTPESGDNVQLMKAGLLEIADIFVVNKADRPGAENISMSIEAMLDRQRGKLEWRPPVLLTSASLGKGIEELYAEIWRHADYLRQDDKLKERRKSQLKGELKQRIESEIVNTLWQKIRDDADIDELVNDIWEQKIDPQSAAGKVVRRCLKD